MRVSSRSSGRAGRAGDGTGRGGYGRAGSGYGARSLASALLACALAVTAAVTVLFGHPGSAFADPPARTPDLAKGAHYLTDPARLLDGHYHEAFPGSGAADFGLTLDTAFALAATGADDDALLRIADFLDHGGRDGTGFTVDDWTGIGTEGAAGGSLGKVALLAETVGRDPRDFGGHDLIAALDAAVCARADEALGCAAPGNYTWTGSVFAQSIGVMAQLRAGDAQGAGAPIAYLRSLQQPAGSWPSLIPASSAADVDSTAMALMALSLVPGDEAGKAVERGLSWLAATQAPDGGFPGAAGNSTNSAALAVQGLSLRQDLYAARIGKAVEFLADRQNPDGGFDVASAGQPGSDVRASAQALGGVTGRSFGTLRRVPGTTPTDPGTSPSPSPSPSPSTSPSPSPSASESPSPSASPSASASSSPTPSPTDPASPTPTATSTGPTAALPTPTSPAGVTPDQGGPPATNLARTGTQALELLAPALLLTVGGAAILVALRRRTASPSGKHR